MRYAAAILALTLSGCATLGAQQAATVVRAPVPVPCRVSEPACAAPAYNGAELGMQVNEKVIRAVAELREREQCIKELRDALAACRDAEPPAALPAALRAGEPRN